MTVISCRRIVSQSLRHWAFGLDKAWLKGKLHAAYHLTADSTMCMNMPSKH